jgi:hypothetical protein
VGGTCCACVAVGGAMVGEDATTVAVGLICSVGDATIVEVFVGISIVFVSIAVDKGSMFTSNCPQAVRDNMSKHRKS